MTILPHLLNDINQKIDAVNIDPSMEEIGIIQEVNPSIVKASGLPTAFYGEMVSFEDGSRGMVMNLTATGVDIALLDAPKDLKAGGLIHRTKELLSVPVGDGLLGRVVDPLGRPMDDPARKVETSETLPIERPAPALMARQAVSVPLQTGIKAIDALIPIGRGQRELILGDRQTGKTAVALDTIINQKNSGVICIYCAIGQRLSSISRLIADLKRYAKFDQCIVVAAEGEAPPGLQYIAPYAATSMGEYFMEQQQKDVLIIYDNLTAQAAAYRQLSLFLRRPPGREAYPGDIFYIHSRLLERATRLRTGGSLTALPICETLAQNVSAYIPTNLISITDGQIFLSNSMFQKGIMPAIDIGISVSRVGGKAQRPMYKSVAGDMKLAYNQFQELEAFSKFGTQLDKETQDQLTRGERIREVLKQRQYKPLPANVQEMLVYAVTSGLFDLVPLDRIRDAESKISEHYLEYELTKENKEETLSLLETFLKENGFFEKQDEAQVKTEDIKDPEVLKLDPKEEQLEQDITAKTEKKIEAEEKAKSERNANADGNA